MSRGTGRTFDERFALRVPAVVGVLLGGLRRMPPGSALRRRLIRRQVDRAFAAMARSDHELVVLLYEPDAAVWMRSLAGVGFGDSYRGPEGIRALLADFDEAFAEWAWTARAVADGGDRFAVRADFVGVGRSSGARTELQDGGTAVRLSDRGLVVWQEWFAEPGGWGKALEAVGLRE